ncbi:hypothetical protein KR044_000993 [Drosophila immigrans]|nr:hypothetical protein KR044_000993 [Drosophila immigrans]
MDDMVYQCSNQNSIYVLNAGYNPSYGDFGTHAMHTQMTATGREMNGSRTTRTRNSIGASCSSAACSLQHKFKSFGTAAATATAAAAANSSNGNSSAMPSSAAMAATATAAAIATTAATMATTIIAATAAPTAAAAATTPATAATTTTTTISTNYVNPVATSMSTAMCSPATAALQKLFNCSVGVGGGNVCQNVSHKNHQQQQQQHQQQSSHNGSNNNCPVGSHNNSCLSATSSSPRSICDPHEGPAGAGAVGAGALPLLGSAMANKKKCTNVKSTLIAKKTKFLKFLEEEKWRSSNNVALLTADDAEACGAPLALLPSSNEAEPYTASTTSAMAATSSLAAHSGIKHNNNNSSNSRDEATASAVGAEQQQNKLNNWSMHNDSNNKLTNYQQEQQQLELNKQTAKSSYELYQEAADILGLSCSLCDNCRCLDCQSGYFDCADDDDESYSEQSLMDEYDEYDYHGYGYEQQASLLTSAHHAGPNQPAMTQPDQHQLQQQQQQQLQAADLNLCYAVDCQQNCIRSDDGEPKEGTFQTDSEYESEPSTATKSEHRLAIDFDLINATSSQVLQNCATFNDLSLLDAERQVQPFT